jgi:hypothetical protein
VRIAGLHAVVSVADQHVQTASQPGEHIPSFICTCVRESRPTRDQCVKKTFVSTLAHSLTLVLITVGTSTRLFSLGYCARISTSTHVLLTTLFGVALQPAQREQVRSRVAVAPVVQ